MKTNFEIPDATSPAEAGVPLCSSVIPYDRLLVAYDTWLQGERNALLVERFGHLGSTDPSNQPRFVLGLLDRETREVWDYCDLTTQAALFHANAEDRPPSTRAAAVLAAAGASADSML